MFDLPDVELQGKAMLATLLTAIIRGSQSLIVAVNLALFADFVNAFILSRSTRTLRSMFTPAPIQQPGLLRSLAGKRGGKGDCNEYRDFHGC
jgi:hypothetical protein